LIPKSTAELIARLPNAKLREKYAGEVLKPEWDKSMMSLRRAKEIQERSYMVQLKGAPFPQQDPELLPAAGPCGTCPKLTGNDRDLFPDGRSDMCTDPACFGQKKTAHFKRLKERAEAQGLQVLDAKTCNKLFSAWSDSLNTSEYLDLAEVCHRDKAKKPRSYKQLLAGSEIKPVIAFDRKGRERRLVPRPAAEKYLKDKHKIELGYASSNHSNAQYQAEERRRLEQHKIRSLARIKITAGIRQHKWKLDLKTLQLLIPALLDSEAYHLEGLVPKEVPKTGAGAGPGTRTSALDWIRKQVMSVKADAELVGVAFQVATFAGLHPWVNGYKADGGGLVDKILDVVGLKLKQVENQARLELAESAPSKDKKKRPAKKRGAGACIVANG
jgi:hypothetical protein